MSTDWTQAILSDENFEKNKARFPLIIVKFSIPSLFNLTLTTGERYNIQSNEVWHSVSCQLRGSRPGY